MAAEAEAVLITGGLATGKTALSTALGDLLEMRGVAGCVLDLDWLCWAWSPHLDAAGLHRLLCDNVRAVVPRLLDEGLNRLVLCRTVLARVDIDDLGKAVGVPVHVIRLTVSRQEAERRLRQRDSGKALDTHLSELDSFALAAEQAAAEAPVIDTTDRLAQRAAMDVLKLLGWLDADRFT